MPQDGSERVTAGVIEHAVGQLKRQTILVSRSAGFAAAIKKKMQPREQ